MHRFLELDETRSQCETCDLITDAHLADELTVHCPSESCVEPANHGEPCVFIDGPDGPDCAYCGRPGDPENRDESDTFGES